MPFLVSLGVLLFLGAELGRFLSVPGISFATLWPPTAIYICALVIAKRDNLFQVILVGFLANFTFNAVHDIGTVTNLLFCAINQTEGLLCAGAVNVFFGGKSLFTDVKKIVLFLIFFVFLVSPFAGLISSYAILRQSDHSSFFLNWRVWWFSDAMGCMVFFPLIGTVMSGWQERNRGWNWRAVRGMSLEFALLLLTLVFTWLVFIDQGDLFPPLLSLPAIIFLCIAVLSAFFGSQVSFIATCLVAVISTYATTRGLGIFTRLGSSIADQLLSLQMVTFIELLVAIVISVAKQERDAANSLLSEAKDVAIHASEAKSNFLASVSHEIRTPISVMLGFAELIKKDSRQNTLTSDYADKILRSGGVLLSLINDVLDFSKIESGKLTIEKMPFALDKMIVEVLDDFDVVARHRNVSLSCKIVDRIPKIVESDVLRLRQIISNLLGNAIKFTEQGFVCLTIRYSAPDLLRPNGCLFFEVLDSGIGISEQNQQLLFLEFHQADPGMARKFGGTGLGLSIVRKLSRLLGGDVELVHSAQGEGSLFRAYVDPGPRAQEAMISSLPRSFADASGSRPVPLRLANSDTTLRPLTASRILLVEDASDLQLIYSKILECSGASVRIASNGEDAIKVLEGGPVFDVIIMDMQMPVVDGYTATRRLRASGLRTPIIALTASAMHDAAKRCLSAGCNEFITKPVEANRLVERVERYLTH